MKQISVVLLILISGLLTAQMYWENDGLPVRQGVNIEWFRSSASIGNDIVYTWSDTRRGDRDVWAQRVDPAGNLMWADGGVMINGKIDRQEDIVMIGVGNDEVVAAWVDFRNGDDGDIYAQKLDANGNLLWNTNGVPVCLDPDEQISLNIVSDENGGAYLIWIDGRNPGGVDIYGTHILTDGTIAAGWDVNGNPIANESGAQNSHTFWEDGEGGAIVAWHDERDADNPSLYMQRITSDGTLMWNTNGNVLCDVNGEQTNVKMSPMGNDTMFFTWRDKRDDADGDLYCRAVNLDGSFAWGETVVYVGNGIQRNPRASSASDGSAFVVWEDGRNDFYFKDIFAQKINADGTLAWDAAGVVVSDADNDQLNPRLFGDDNGGTWIIWDDARGSGYPEVDIYVQHLNANGQPQLVNNGLIICDAPGEQFAPLVKDAGNGKIYANWGDNRTGSTGIYLQILDDAGNTQLAANGAQIWYGLSGDAVNYKLMMANETPVVTWIDTRNSVIANQIYMQVINPDGSFVLAEDGESITEMTNHDQENMDVVYGNNLVAAAWEENRGDFKQIFAQAVDLNNNYIWSVDTGLQVGNVYAQQEYAKIDMMGSDFNIGWSDYRDWMSGYDIYAQKIDASGTMLWGAEGKLIASNPGDDVLNDVVEDYYIWRGGDIYDQNIYVKRVDADGNTAAGWPDAGLTVCSAPQNQEKATGMMTPDGLLIIWRDKRDGNFDIYGQIVQPDGTFLWADNGLALVQVANDQDNFQFVYNNDIAMVWEDFRNASYYDIYMQRFDGTGGEIWQEDGIEVIQKNSNQVSPTITTDGEYYFIFWEDYTIESQSNLYGQKITLDGTKWWAPEGKLISDAIKNQNAPLAVTDSGENVYVIWEDTRSSGKTDIYNIYAQKIDVDTSVNPEAPTPVNHILSQNYPNPFVGTTTISMNLKEPVAPEAKLNIYNVRGQLVRSLQPVDNSFSWDGKNAQGKAAAEGIYLYRLEGNGTKTAARKMILLK
jgi:hypothetical protein